MCQNCVARGVLTQDELDRKVLEGDSSVMPLMALSEDQAIEVIAGMVDEVIANGANPKRALDIGILVFAEYYEATGRKPS